MIHLQKQKDILHYHVQNDPICFMGAVINNRTNHKAKVTFLRHNAETVCDCHYTNKWNSNKYYDFVGFVTCVYVKMV